MPENELEQIGHFPARSVVSQEFDYLIDTRDEFPQPEYPTMRVSEDLSVDTDSIPDEPEDFWDEGNEDYYEPVGNDEDEDDRDDDRWEDDDEFDD